MTVKLNKISYTGIRTIFPLHVSFRRPDFDPFLCSSGKKQIWGPKTLCLPKAFLCSHTQATGNQILEYLVQMCPSLLPRTALLYSLDLVVHEATVIISLKKANKQQTLF